MRLHAIRNRPEDKRAQFCIFVDEFQNFASSEDFKTLITEARKFGVATTIAHQERFGQFSEDKKIQGATAAAANKVFFQTTVKDAQELAPEFAEKAGDIKTLVGGELIISPRAVEDIWEKGHPNKYIMDIRKRYFWLTNLVQSNPKETYFQFDPTNLPQTNPVFHEYDIHPAWGSFDDWGMYRASAEMIKKGIALLDEYYYDWMQQKRSESDPITDREVQQVLKIVECFSGVFGFRPTMEPYIPDEMRRAYMHRFAEQRGRAIEKAIQEYRRMEAENRRHGIYKSSYPYPDLPTSEDKYVKQTVPELLKIGLSDIPSIPSRLTTKFVQTWRNFAIKRGFSQYELEQFIQWRVRPFTSLEEEVLTAIVKINMQNTSDLKTIEKIFSKYHAVMLSPMLREELGFEFEDKLKSGAVSYEMQRQLEAFYKKVRPLILWQYSGLQGFINYGIHGGGRALKLGPIKVPSGKHDETPKRERTQAEMIDVMAQTLTNLPRFTAYAKIIQEKGGEQTVWKGPIIMPTLPPHQEPPIVEGEKQPEIASHVIKQGHSFCKERAQIEEEIRQRQERWRGSVSDEPPPTHD